MPGEAQIRKALTVKKAHGKVDLKVVDRLQSLHKDGFPELVRSTGACGMPAAVLVPHQLARPMVREMARPP